MQTLLPLAERAALLLKQHQATVWVAESSVGGLISAALLAMPGASAYFLGGAVVYTRHARTALLGITEAQLTGMRPSTEPYALLLARAARERFGTTWALAETGATGPTGNRYGDAAGHACLALVGTSGVGGGERAITVETGNADRQGNMRAFGIAALNLLIEALDRRVA